MVLKDQLRMELADLGGQDPVKEAPWQLGLRQGPAETPRRRALEAHQPKPEARQHLQSHAAAVARPGLR